MKYIFIFLALLNPGKSFSQHFFVSLAGGASNYQGDLSEGLYQPRHTHLAYGVGLLFELNTNMLIRGDFAYGRLSGSDASGVKNRNRNLSFTSSFSEFSLAYEYVLLDLYYYKFSPYLFAGVGLFKFSPYTKDDNGNLFSLWDLRTEGQGIVPDRKRYKLSEICLPFGGGVQWAVSDNVRIGLVLGIRQTFTDYIDDVSKTYVDQSLLTARAGPIAAKYAYRGDDLANGDPYPEAGTQRGNPTNKDWYYITGVTLRFRIQRKKHRRMTEYKFPKSRVSCPRPL